MAPLIHISALVSVSCHLHASLALPPGKDLQAPIEQVACWARELGREINLLPLPTIELRFVGRRSHSSVTVTAVGICASGR